MIFNTEDRKDKNMLKCPKCKKRGIDKGKMMAASGGDIITCTLCGEEFVYKKINNIRFVPIYILGFLMIFVFILWFMFVSQYLHEIVAYVSVVVPAIILYKARQSIYLDTKNLAEHHK